MTDGGVVQKVDAMSRLNNAESVCELTMGLGTRRVDESTRRTIVE